MEENKQTKKSKHWESEYSDSNLSSQFNSLSDLENFT